MEFRLTVENRVAAVSGITELICGNSDYTVRVDTDTEWNDLAITLHLLIHRDGSTESLEIPITDHTAALPAIHNAYAISLGIAADGLTSTPARLSCARCITDGTSADIDDVFDPYHAILQYIADARNSVSEEQLAAEFAVLAAHDPAGSEEDYTGAAYRAAITASVRSTRLDGSIEMLDGTSVSFDDRSIASGSFGIETDCMTGDFILPGGVPSAELTTSFYTESSVEELYGSEITPIFRILLPTGRWCPVQLGTFTVYEAVRESGHAVHITAYDDMRRLDGIPVSAVGFRTDRIYQPQEIITLCADAAGITYEDDVSEYINADAYYDIEKLSTSVETARDLLMYTVQTLCAFAHIDRARKLRIVPLSVRESCGEIPAAQIKSRSISALPYRLFQLNTVIEFTEFDGVNQSVPLAFQTLYASGVTAELPENPLLRTIHAIGETIQSVLTRRIKAIVNALDPVVFRPHEITFSGDPAIALWEWRSVGSGNPAPVTAYRWQYHGSVELTANGTEAIAGISRSQAAKRARGEHTDNRLDNIMRTVNLQLLQLGGEDAMSHKTEDFLCHYTEDELSSME